MYILTENNEIIYTENYWIGFNGNELNAFHVFPQNNQRSNKILIARFKNETEAEASLKDVFNTIYQKGKIWSAEEYKEELYDTPPDDTPPDDTPPDDTSMSDWPKWEQDVGDIIVEMYEIRDPSGQTLFKPRDLRNYYPRLRSMWPENNHISATVNKMLTNLISRGVLEKPTYSQYRIVEGELLYLHLKLRVSNKVLSELKQKTAELEKQLDN